MQENGDTNIFEQLSSVYRNKNWNETIVYIGIGCHIKRAHSSDQQIPSFLKRYYNPNEKARVKIFLFDPNFRNELPVAIKVEEDQWEVVNSRFCKRGNVVVSTSALIIEKEFRIFSFLSTYIREFLLDGGKLFMGCFCVPYMLVPENKDIVDLYNELILDPQIDNTNFQYFHLASYATDLTPTRIWYMNGKPFNQDKAMLKEAHTNTVNNKSNDSISFGVSSYVLNPGRMFMIEFPINYQILQDSVNQELQKYSHNSLTEEECDIANLKIHF